MKYIIQPQQNSILSSPLAGKIVKILVHEGDTVEEGQDTFVVESMKMFHVLRAAKTGHMRNIAVKEGDSILPKNHLAYIL